MTRMLIVAVLLSLTGGCCGTRNACYPPSPGCCEGVPALGRPAIIGPGPMTGQPIITQPPLVMPGPG